jgi:hypothetical protein
MPAGPPPAMQQRTDTFPVAMGVMIARGNAEYQKPPRKPASVSPTWRLQCEAKLPVDVMRAGTKCA